MDPNFMPASLFEAFRYTLFVGGLAIGFCAGMFVGTLISHCEWWTPRSSRPENLDLRPRDSRRVRARIIGVLPPRFTFIDDDAEKPHGR